MGDDTFQPLEGVRRHQVEDILGRNQAKFDIHSIKRVAFLMHEFRMKPSSHACLSAPRCQLTTYLQSSVGITLGFSKVINTVSIVEGSGQVALLCLSSIVQCDFNVSSVGMGVF